MADPISLIALGAAVGGAAGKFVEKAWDSGEKWLQSYYANHKEKAQEKARKNSAAFINDLASNVKLLEEQQKVTNEVINSAQDHPEFAVLLQKALIASAQTESPEKHQLLARLVAERLRTGPDSRLTVVTKLACDAIPNLTTKHLKMLGLMAELTFIKNGTQLAPELAARVLESRLSAYSDLDYDPFDIIHLEGLSCVKHISFSAKNLRSLMTDRNKGAFDWDSFVSTDTGKHILGLWDRPNVGFTGVSLTSIGMLIGIYVADLLTGTRTELGEL